MKPLATDTDTIAAIATPTGMGGIGVLRVSGSRSQAIALSLTGKTLLPRKFHFCTFRDANGETLDRGLVVYFAAPRSFTGEDIVELHAHGSPIMLNLLLRRVLDLGAALARAGEFSERAFLNGKLDLTQAEAIADLIASGSEIAARAAIRSLDGEFAREVHKLLAALVRLRSWLEAALDFPQEEIDFLATPQISADIDALQAQIVDLLVATRRGVVLRDGLHVVIIGRPNVGKSSLLNALAQSERAIVTAIAGTTRDVVREEVHLDGIALTLADTAGLHESSDPVEQEGMRRTRAEIERADVLVLVTDKDDGDTDQDLFVNHAHARIIVHNKIDIRNDLARVEVRGAAEIHIWLSAQRGDGLPYLREQLARLAGGGEGAQGAFSARTRHVHALERVAEHIRAAAETLLMHRAGELAAEELRRAQQSLAEITGEYTSDDLLGSIFTTFCIGK